MIYKIIMDFTELDEIVKVLSNKFNLIFVGNAIYICDKKYANTTIKYIKKLLNNDNVFIIKIDENNLSQEPINVINWCKDKFVQKDLKKYEKEHNDEIKNFMQILDDFEKELELIVQESKKGVINK